MNRSMFGPVYGRRFIVAMVTFGHGQRPALYSGLTELPARLFCISMDANVRFNSDGAAQPCSYEKTIHVLNTLQSNASVREKIALGKDTDPVKKLAMFKEHLGCSGIKLDVLDQLNVIHVSGTKGKGSTCAFAESILRQHGYRTGFFSSPHLVQVRERIRVNCQPISEHEFVRYFWRVYERLKNAEAEDQSGSFTMPPYFQFLTIMAFHVFLDLKVDVAIIEVGIGGTYDCTNVIRKPVVCGISTLDFDHLSILGYTIEEIAGHKAGIMKPGAPVVTVPQPSPAMAVLLKQSHLVNCPLFVAPPYRAYVEAEPDSNHLNFGIPGPHQFYNVSMALQLTRIWRSLREHHSELPIEKSGEGEPRYWDDDSLRLPMLDAGVISAVERLGIETCSWPGRCQVVAKEDMLFYLDGAHTPTSMKYTSQWFDDMVKENTESDLRPIYKALVFHCTSERNAIDLLSQFQDMNFDLALFCPPTVFPDAETSADVANYMVSVDGRMKKCFQNRCAWLKLFEERCSADQSMNDRHSKPLSSVVACVSDAVNYIELLNRQLRIGAQQPVPTRMHILVTGSLHLVGGFLQVLNLTP